MSVYAIQGIEGGPIKVGYSSSPEQRLAQLQTAHHEELVVLYSFEAKPHYEGRLQEQLEHLHIRGEWYSDSPQVLTYLRTCEVGIRLETLLREACTSTIMEIGPGFDRDAASSRLHAFVDELLFGLDVVQTDALKWLDVPA